ncbi:MAG: DNA polymerase [Gallionella sp.]|jgi:uracil-DNA glycosylase family 4
MPKLVMGSGPIDAKIVFVGEAPGAEEERLGKPFIGSSGELLTNIMHQTGISREEVYITNVVKERPPANDITKFIKFDKGKLTKTKAYDDYENMLYEELGVTTANIYVAVGGVALWALCRQDKISKRRGSILQGSFPPTGGKVIPIIHPASALRNYAFTHFIRFDMRRILEESAFPEVRLPSRMLKVDPSFIESIAYTQSCQELPIIGFDIEVVNEEISCISIARSPYDVISIPFYADGRDIFTVDQEAAVWREIAKLLENPDIIKVGHNITFDATFIFIKYGIVTRNMKDTMINCSISYPDFPKGLDFVTSICTKEPYYKDDGKKWFKLGGSIHDFWIYNAKDSAVCLESLPVLEAEVQRQGNEGAVERQTSIVPSLVYMQARGIQADKAGMDSAIKEYDVKIAELQAELDKCCGYCLNPNSSKQLQDYFYIRKGVKPYISRTTGNISVDAVALKRLSKRGFREAQIILEMRHLLKIKSTYFEMEMDSDNRIRCSFNPVGTENGRLSSSKTIFGKGGNMQNLPPEMLRFLVADPGCFLYNIDLSQAENRIVAYCAPEPNMIEAFEKGIDIHRQTAGLLFNKPPEEISDDEGSSSIGGGLFSERFWGKKSNHSLNYDLGYRSFALVCEIQDNEAKYIVERYHSVYPGVRQYHAWIRAQLSKNRTITNCLGRKRLFTSRWGDELFKEAYAFIPQSTVADIINARGLAYVMDNPLFQGAEILNQVHDSLIVQISYETVPVLRHAEILKLLVTSLQQPISFRGREFSIPADTHVGVTLNKKKMKGVPVNEQPTSEGLARELSRVHNEIRASNSI